MAKEEENIFDIEIEYENLKKRYTLPPFESLAQDFDIEKLADKETIFLAREIRRTINEKIIAYLHLLETLISPNNPPIFVFKILKNISSEEKEEIQKFYKILSKTQIEIMKLDTIYSEAKEIKFIEENFKVWQKMKPEIYKLFESFESNFENSDTSNKKSYFD